MLGKWGLHSRLTGYKKGKRKLRTIHEVDVSEGIECGGFHYTLDSSPAAARDVLLKNRFADSWLNDCKIRIDTQWSSERISESLIHEISHVVNNIYMNDQLTEKQITVFAHGLHQVMESLGVRFVVKKEEV